MGQTSKNSSPRPAKLTPKSIARFQQTIYRYYRDHKRDFLWRQTTDPYSILVSEVMLQQTQTSRVISKYQEFITAFPNVASLARAPLRQVLQVWQGLGYNRRALALHKTAQTIVSSFNGKLPSSPETLATLPGIGAYTASAIAALAFNQPAAFIETNIRTIFLHFFFPDRENVSDRDILPLVASTVDKVNPREWYYALFDYGAMLKKESKHGSGSSAHHRKQLPYQGSNRQLRGQIVRLLLAHRTMTEQQLARQLQQKTAQVRDVVNQLQEEGFLNVTGGTIKLG